jgi:hypothetical protein
MINMNKISNQYCFSRRDALKALWSGFGYMAFAGLATRAAVAEAAPKAGPLLPKASRLITSRSLTRTMGKR